MGLDALVQFLDGIGSVFPLSEDNIRCGYERYTEGWRAHKEVSLASDPQLQLELRMRSISQFKTAWAQHQCILSFLMLISLGLNEVNAKKRVKSDDINYITIQSFLKDYILPDHERQLESHRNADNLLWLFALFGVTPHALYAYPVHIPLICALTLSALSDVVDERSKESCRAYGRACASLAASIYAENKESNIVLFGTMHFSLTNQAEFGEFSLDTILSMLSVSKGNVNSCRDAFFKTSTVISQQQIKETKEIITARLQMVGSDDSLAVSSTR